MSKIALTIYRICHTLNGTPLRIIAILLNKAILRIIFGCQIGLGAKIGKRCVIGYGGLGVVIHKGCIIGDDVNIGPGVTLGGNTKAIGVPTIGNNTIIATGAKIIGNISIGNNCVIGANAVVLKSIPNNCVAVGVPARIIKTNINIDNYR